MTTHLHLNVMQTSQGLCRTLPLRQPFVLQAKAEADLKEAEKELQELQQVLNQKSEVGAKLQKVLGALKVQYKVSNHDHRHVQQIEFWDHPNICSAYAAQVQPRAPQHQVGIRMMGVSFAACDAGV
jgi:hypothetical protein